MSAFKETPSKFQALVAEFCSITGATDEVGRHLLDACGGNLEMAICMHLDSPAAPAEDAQSASLPETAHENDEEVRAPIPQRREVLVDDHPGFGPRPRRRVARSVFDGFRDFQAEARQQAELLATAAAVGEDTIPGANSGSQKRRTLEDLFRPPIDLLHKGTFESAKEVGCKKNKWLMVNVQNVKEFQCQVLNRDVWSNDAVRSLIRQHFVLWQVYSDSDDGMRFSRFYQACTWPYIAVLDPRTGEKLVTWTHSDPLTFCDLVSEFLSAHSSPSGPSDTTESPPSKRKKRENSVVEQSEDDQLQAAIKASLAESSVSVSEDDEDNILADDLETFSGSEDDTSRDSVSVVIKPPTLSPVRETNGDAQEGATDKWKKFLGCDEDHKCTMMFRFPNGKRSQISIPESSSLRALVEYAIQEGFPNERYELVTTFPRRKLSHLDFDHTLKSIGLPTQETIFVQER